jgi:polysaccharide export outer membrane protein
MPSRQVFVQGQVNHPGAFSLQPGMTALQAIASAGGHTDEAAMQNVVLIRRDACGRPDGSKLDLASASDTPDKGEDVMLMPHDTLVVPRSKIANMDLFMKQYVRDLLPVQPYITPPIP